MSFKGDFGIATPFTDVTVDQISNLLHIYGYQKRGWEVRERDTQTPYWSLFALLLLTVASLFVVCR